ncbi:MAG TPA: 4Fe-4S binding protein [Gaiellaceae bacterium]|nr:4Fe-4S binding protein [Gaiellaceae bacterium]
MSVEDPVTVAICDGLADAAAVRDALDKLPGVHPAVVRGLSRRPERGAALAVTEGAERLVMVVRGDGASRDEVQRQARRAGLDPFAVELVRVTDAEGATPAVALRVGAAVARLRAFGGTAPEQLRPRLLDEQATTSRRSLLTLPPLTYDALPKVPEERCHEPQRCRLCVDACPHAALEAEPRRIVVDAARCDGCGLCVAACPRGAVDLPAASPAEYEARLDALLTAGADALVFSCRHARLDAASWAPVEVPCAAMVTPGWVLQALVHGAGTVAVVPCGDCFCGDQTERRVSYLRELLTLLGDEHATARVQLRPEAEPPGLPPLARSRSPQRLSEPVATAEVLRGLGDVGSLVHDASPLGLVEVSDEACTACGACATVCPTGALRLDQTAGDASISFDAAACVGCGRCALACPEAANGAIATERTTDLGALARGRVALKREPLVRCQSCGRPIAPRRLLERVGELVADEPLLGILAERCADCRSLRTVAERS